MKNKLQKPMKMLVAGDSPEYWAKHVVQCSKKTSGLPSKEHKLLTEIGL